MQIATIALLSYALYLGLAFGLRTAIQLGRSGDSGFRGIGGSVGSAEWVAGVLFAAALFVGVAAPVMALLDVIEPLVPLDRTPVHLAGLVLFVAGLGATLGAQLAMGSSWRIGVDPEESTALVTHGPFAWVRNPIFSAMLPTSLGLTLMVPSWLALAGFVALIVALELQVRVVEEPYLRQAHGEAYAEYEAHVGRFVPGVGRGS
jgi:protein-S-isoprenylcysteine O-methyltransferase Ste14